MICICIMVNDTLKKVIIINKINDIGVLLLINPVTPKNYSRSTLVNRLSKVLIKCIINDSS